MGQNKFLIVSNRLPVQINNGRIIPSDGGLVSAIKGADLADQAIWFGHLGPDTPTGMIKDVNCEFQCFNVSLDAQLYHQYYDGFCNELIWPAFHEKLDYVEYTEESWKAYLGVNETFAHEILENTSSDTPVWIHDYHLMMVPFLIKKRQPQRKVSFFLHIPWPYLATAGEIPHLATIAKSLLCSDFISFHSQEYVRDFINYSKHVLAREIPSLTTKLYEKVISTPIGIAPKEFQPTPEFLPHVQPEDKIILIGVDRFDYSKGIDIKLEIYLKFLKENPTYHEKIQLKQLLIPTRENIPAYRRYKNRIIQLTKRINEMFETRSWKPIELIIGRMSRAKLVNFYRKGDVCLITSLRDGMNLVSMEFLAAQSPNDPGQLVLSDKAGVCKYLSSQIRFDPNSINSGVRALHEALNTKIETRKLRWQNDIRWVKNNTSKFWALINLRQLGISKGNNKVFPPFQFWDRKIGNKVRILKQ